MDFNVNLGGKVEVHHYYHQDPDTSKEVLTLLREIKSQGETMHQEFLDFAKKIDDATTAVAQRLDKLSGQLKNSMSDDELNQVRKAMQAEVDRLTVLGQDPNNPVPTP